MSAIRRLAAAAAALLLVPGQVAAQPDATAEGAATDVALPDWRGIWFLEGAESAGIAGVGTEDNYRPPVMNPAGPWTELGRAELMKVFEGGGSRKSPGWGYPMMMMSLTPVQFVVTPDRTLILNTYRDLREVFTDGRPLSAVEDRVASTWGESIGHWEGDTLVIETVGVRRPDEFFHFAPPLSEDARYLERIRRVGPDRMEVEMTVEDPVKLTAPLSFKVAYVRADGLDRFYHDTFTNDRSEVEDGVFAILPPGEVASEQ